MSEELEAIKQVFSLKGPIAKGGRNYYQGTIKAANGKDYTVLCTQSNDVGNIDAGIAVTDVINQFNPKIFLLVGIAGGVNGRENLELGDVAYLKE